MSVSVLFVCLGNICVLPRRTWCFANTSVMQGWKSKFVLIAQVPVIGILAARIRRAAARRGYDMSSLRARQVSPADFYAFDVVLAMDNANLADLEAMRPSDASGILARFLDYATDSAEREVPDPYYGGNDGFDQVLDLVEDGARGLLASLQERL